MSTAENIALAGRVQGIPAPPPFYADDFMVGCILVCGLILASVMSDRKHFLPRLLKSFFLPHEQAIESIRTTNIVYMRTQMYIVSYASAGLLLTAYATARPMAIATALLWLLATVAVVLLHLLRVVLFAITDRIFLDPSTQTAWEQSYNNWAILSAIPLYLSAIIAIFFNLTPAALLWLIAVCVVVLEFCLLYKAFHIFSGKKYGILQLFLYLCALELIPLLVAGKALVLFV